MKIGIVVSWMGKKVDDVLKDLNERSKDKIEKHEEDGLTFFRPVEDSPIPTTAFKLFDQMCKEIKPLGTGVERPVYVWANSIAHREHIVRYAERLATSTLYGEEPLNMSHSMSGDLAAFRD